MADEHALQAGNALFEAFVEQVKQALEHLYDFAFLQQHALARHYDGENDISAKSAGRQLRYALISAIESLKPKGEAHFRAPDARLYNILHLIYVENLTIQEAAAELGLSERQAYRDLKRGQESVAAVLWDSQLPPVNPAQDFSLQSEIARIKIRFSPVDIVALFEQSQGAVARLAQQQGVTFVVKLPDHTLTLSTDPSLAHQTLVSVLSYAVQQAEPGVLTASFAEQRGSISLALQYQARPNWTPLTDSMIPELVQRLRWNVAVTTPAAHPHRIELQMAVGSATIVVIDDNEGWVSLLERFLEGQNCAIVALPDSQESLEQIPNLAPSAIILDVMMPDKDGWEILQRLRAQTLTANIPIIVCTVFNDSQLAYSLGASAFLSKPTDRERILETLKELDIF